MPDGTIVYSAPGRVSQFSDDDNLPAPEQPSDLPKMVALVAPPNNPGDNLALWEYENPKHFGDTLTPICDDHPADAKLDSSISSAWEKHLGFPPPGDCVGDAIAALFSSHSDPEGFTGPYPAMPRHDGLFLIPIPVYDGHIFQAIDFGKPAARGKRNATTFDRIQKRKQLDLAEVFASDAALAAKVLDATGVELNLSDEELVQFVPPELRDQLKRGKKATRYAEDWTAAADNAAITNTLTWTEVSSTGHFQIGSSKARTVDSIAAQCWARAEHSLSSTNMRVEATGSLEASSTGGEVGVAGRHASAASTLYGGAMNVAWARVVFINAGFLTEIGITMVTVADVTPTKTLRLDCNGGSIDFVYDPTTLIYGASAFNTSITSSAVRGGLFGFGSGVASKRSQWFTWSARDIAEILVAGNRLMGVVRS